jgi:hypothetical protein
VGSRFESEFPPRWLRRGDRPSFRPGDRLSISSNV